MSRDSAGVIVKAEVTLRRLGIRKDCTYEVLLDEEFKKEIYEDWYFKQREKRISSISADEKEEAHRRNMQEEGFPIVNEENT